MSKKLEPISVRTTRLNNLILGNSKCTSKANKSTIDALSRDGLLDAFVLLYNECDKEQLKKRDKNVNEFVTKYRPVIEETNSLRISYDDFNVKTIIGKGYFGNVHLVTEKTSNDVYAMKIIKKSVVTTSQVKEERDIMAKRNSEWITNLQYAFQDSESLYLVMEYLPGGDLLSLMIRNGAFEEELAKFYLAELTLAINDLHQMGYIHRDIKPENILIDRFGHIKLADFGNAAALNKDGHVLSLSPVGTPDYIAPELLQTISSFKLSKSTHDVSCDFWSMGIIGYELVCETTPFHEENVHETYSKILTHCEDSHSKEVISFATEIKLTENFKNLIQSLVTKPTKRLTYAQIRKHQFFEGTKWDSMRQRVPPIIPNVNGDDDVSNFEDIERNKGRRSTFIKKVSNTTNIKANEFSGKDLPYLGYSFVYHEQTDDKYRPRISEDVKVTKLNMKIKDMQTVMKSQTDEIRCLQESLHKADQKAKQSDSISKILTDSKQELNKVKDSLKQKTIELASCKTEIKTLQNSLKIDEEMRLKNDDTISEILRSTYKKWEKAKTTSDQNYEKQIAEKKTEISNITQKLKQRENELSAKSEECQHLQDKLENYKEMLKSIKDQAATDKQEFEKSKKQLSDDYETKFIEIRNKLKKEKDSKNRLTFQLRDVQTELDESICSTNSNKQAKLLVDKNFQEIKDRLNREIETNNTLRAENMQIEKIRSDIEKSCENLRNENEKLQKEIELLECSKNLHVSGSSLSSPYQTAHGSLTELHTVEELRNDLASAKEGEDVQRKRAEQLEKAVEKLEAIIAKLNEQPKSVGDMLEKRNEKLESNLATAREQMVLERQSARTANLSMWKLEKQVEDLQHENKMVKRRMELTEEKMKRQQNQREDIERSLKDAQSECNQKDLRIKELREEISNLKNDIQKEHKMWEKAEQERMKEKSEVLGHISKVHNLEEKSQELRQKLLQAQKKNDTLSLENVRILRELNELRDQKSTSSDELAEVQTKLKNTEYNYEMLKEACKITETQITEIEELLNVEMKRNKANQVKIDELNRSLREKNDTIAQYKKDVNVGASKKFESEEKMKNLTNEFEELRQKFEESQKKIIAQQTELIRSSQELYEAQEKIELLLSESNSMQTMNANCTKEIHILKEEGTRVLTELFMIKEEEHKLAQELKEANQMIAELKDEIEELNGTLSEQKNHYVQREIKSEATLAQHKKLIDYLQIKVEDLSQLKKKKSFADKLFGSGTASAKKENISPNAVESSILYRTLQEELKREKQKSKVLQEQLDKLNTIEPVYAQIVSSPSKRNTINKRATEENKQITEELAKPLPTESPKKTNTLPRRNENIRGSTASTTSNNKRRPYQTHRMELTLETDDSTTMICVACYSAILIKSPYFKCKECKCCAHRKCRGDVKSSCDGIETTYEPPEKDVEPMRSIDTVDTNLLDKTDKEYHGDLICKAVDHNNMPIEINCAYEISENVVLIGANTGLFAYHRDNETVVHISGISSVNYIAVTATLSKAILVGASGALLYQCDLRHLVNRSQANACMKPKLEASVLDLPFANKAHDEKWHLVKISEEMQNAIESIAIAATSTRIVIMKYDLSLQRFKPVRALDTATSVSSILFTRHTAIVASDKFFEIDLTNFTAEEFVDLSDSTLSHTRTCQPISTFRISPQEFLVCFTECGIFVDEYGCRSRPYDISWHYTPTGFMYCAPFLYISHFQIVQIIRLHRSYRNDVAESKTNDDDSSDDESAGPVFKRVYLNLNMSTILTESGKNNCLAIAINKESGKQEMFCLNAIKAMKKKLNISMETISSVATCVTLDSESSGSLL